MTRVLIIVEGKTEEDFVANVLAGEFATCGLYLSARRLGKPGHKGGNVKWERLRRDIRQCLLGDRAAYTTTLFDYFRMGTDFPGYPYPGGSTTVAKRQAVEEGILQGLRDSGLDDDALRRFVPYVQMHEFEGILFSDPARFAAGIFRENLKPDFAAIRSSFPTPEDINDGPTTAPSKRIEALFPGHQKAVHGPQAAQAVELDILRASCPNFNEWLVKLETLGEQRQGSA